MSGSIQRGFLAAFYAMLKFTTTYCHYRKRLAPILRYGRNLRLSEWTNTWVNEWVSETDGAMCDCYLFSTVAVVCWYYYCCNVCGVVCCFGCILYVALVFVSLEQKKTRHKHTKRKKVQNNLWTRACMIRKRCLHRQRWTIMHLHLNTPAPSNWAHIS